MTISSYFFKACQLAQSLAKAMPAILVCAALSFTQAAHADEKPLPDLDPKFYSLKETNPTRDAGYVVGDALDRTIEVTIKKPYELVKESIPIVGYEHRWKGQISGIELININTSDEAKSDAVKHTLKLRYMVFTTAKTVKHGALKAEVLKVRNTQTKEVVRLRVPFFDFRISPLSLFGQIKLNEDMSPFIPPLTLNAQQEKLNVKILAAVLVVSLLGLLYMFGAYAWLPKMGGPFAKAYRDIRKLPETPEGLQKAVARVHQSLNLTAGGSLFGNHIAEFVRTKPAFAPMQAEIDQFFNLSRQVFFEPEAGAQLGASPKNWLLKFCKQLRDCERGLPVEAAQK